MQGTALDHFRPHAREVIADAAELESVLAEAQQRAVHSAVLHEVVPSLSRFVAASAGGEFDDADEDDVEIALAALLYVVSPWDQTPDYLPDGLRDDEVVARAVTQQLERALREFEAWRLPPARRPRRRA